MYQVGHCPQVLKKVLGAVFQMISHGLISAALFLCIGMLYARTGTLEIAKYFGIVKTMPKFGFMFILFSMASIGLPGMSGFIGEFLAMIGMFKSIGFFTGFIALGTILSAVYMLSLCNQTIWGVSYSKLLNNRSDGIEFFVLILLAVLSRTNTDIRIFSLNGTVYGDFYVLLTVHLSIISDNDQLDTQLLYFILQYFYYNPLHVSSIICSKHVEDYNKRIVK